MDKATLVRHIELAPPILVVLAYGVGWLFFRQRTRALLRRWRTVLVVAGVMYAQILIAHNIYMKGFDHGAAGQPRDDAYLSFYHGSSYIAKDLNVYDNPFLQMLFLFAANSAFLWLLGREREEAAQRLATATGGRSQAPPETSTDARP